MRPFTICSADGRIADLFGPYFATNNDASIILNVLEENSDLNSLLKPGDVFILDRGFRDCVKELTEKFQFSVHMPTCNTIFITYKSY